MLLNAAFGLFYFDILSTAQHFVFRGMVRTLVFPHFFCDRFKRLRTS